MITVTPPTSADWLSTFVRGVMGVSTAALPDNSIYLGWAYNQAVELTNIDIQSVSPLNYKLAVYNLGGSNLLNYAGDVPGSTYWADLREKLDLNSLNLGIVSSSSDQGTSTTFLVPDFLKNLSFADLAYLRDPYGRRYLQIAQRYTSVWGIT